MDELAPGLENWRNEGPCLASEYSVTPKEEENQSYTKRLHSREEKTSQIRDRNTSGDGTLLITKRE